MEKMRWEEGGEMITWFKNMRDEINFLKRWGELLGRKKRIFEPTEKYRRRLVKTIEGHIDRHATEKGAR